MLFNLENKENVQNYVELNLRQYQHLHMDLGFCAYQYICGNAY